MENKISRRDFLKGAGVVAAGVALSNVELKAEAANPSFNDVYGSFVNAFADGQIGASENIYGIQVTMGSVEQFDVTYKGKKFIYEYYANCIKNKSKGSLSNFYKDANQKAFLDQCEAFLHHLSVYPNDTAVATNFLNYVKDNMLIKGNKTAEGEFANFDPHYIKDVALFETVCEMVQVAWDKIPAIKNLYKNTKPEDMGDTQGYWCGQVIVDHCAGRSDNSDRNISSRRSGITKGNTQFEELIMLNYYAPNDEIKVPLQHLNHLLQSVYDKRNIDFQVAYKKGKSVYDNAKIHEGNKYVFNIDLKDFYPSCKRDLVRKYISFLFNGALNKSELIETFLDIILII